MPRSTLSNGTFLVLLLLCLRGGLAHLRWDRALPLVTSTHLPDSLVAVVSSPTDMGDGDLLDLVGATEDSAVKLKSVTLAQLRALNDSESLCDTFVIKDEDLAAGALSHLYREHPGSCPRRKLRVVMPEGSLLDPDLDLEGHQRMMTFGSLREEGNATSIHEWRPAGLTSSLCDSAMMSECDGLDVSGDTVRVTYDSWRPLFYTNDNGTFGGLFYEVIVQIAKELNITLEWVPNVDPGKWGSSTGDGRWNGMVGMVHEGMVDVAASGFSATPERRDIIDFSINVVPITYRLLIPRPSKSQVSIQNYFYEFDRHIWASIAATGAALALAFAFFFRRLGLASPYSSAAAAVLRGLIYKGSPVGAAGSTPSLKTLLLVNLLFCTVVVVSYRSCLNAFLTVSNPILAVRNLQDAADAGMTPTFWAGGSIENSFANAPPGSAERVLYERYRKDDRAHMASYDEGLDNVLSEEDYVMIGPPQLMPKLPCDVRRVPNYIFKRSLLAFVTEHDSRVGRALNGAILKMRQSGVIDRLKERYFQRQDDGECGGDDGGGRSAAQVSLSFENVFTPFGLLSAGAAAGTAVAFLEWIKRWWRKEEENNIINEDGRSLEKLKRARCVFQSSSIGCDEKVLLLERIFARECNDHKLPVY